jgi:hypothetical protein
LIKAEKTARVSTASLPRRLAVLTLQQRAASCTAKTKSGTPCKAHAVRGKNFCLLHLNPENAVNLGRRGGHRRAIYSPDALTPFAAPTNVHQQAAILAQVQVEVHQGKLDPRVASTIGTLAGAYLNALEIIEFGSKLQQLEKLCRMETPLARLTQ